MQKRRFFRSKHTLFYLALAFIVMIAFATAGELVKIPGSSWNTNGNAKFKIQKAGTVKGPMWPDIYFGPQSGLGKNYFLVELDDGEDVVDVVGKYFLKKGKLKVMNAFKSPLADSLKDVFNKYAGMYGINFDISVQKVKTKCSPKSKKSKESIKYQFQAKFMASAMGEHVKVSLDVKSAGGH